mgnify:CR=1 FL=1
MAKKDKVVFLSDYIDEEQMQNLSSTNRLYNITYEEILRLANFAEYQRDLAEEIDSDKLNEKISNVVEKKLDLIDELKNLKDFLTKE